ncbi:hypothetical protein AOA77_25225 [Pseudomonas paraeruginosa]|nr:hypothetical protein AN920_29395 [Pseudomonas paraeruginosa]KQB29362.1 hypothetical protein AOA77_25225 [Pseudomonas paraeruginosa]
MQAGEGQPGCIIDGHVYELPAGPIGTLLTVASDPMSWLPEAAELLDVQVQEVAGVGVLVAHHHRSGLQLGQSMKASLLETARNGTDGHVEYLGDLSVGLAGST